MRKMIVSEWQDEELYLYYIKNELYIDKDDLNPNLTLTFYTMSVLGLISSPTQS